MKRYTLYKFPSLYGTPKEFNFKFMMYLYAIFNSQVYSYEYRDNETGEYKHLV